MNVPRLRFKEFSEEWKKIRLEEIYPKIRNGFVGIATPYYVENGVKYLQGKNIKNGSIDKQGLIYISKEFHDKYKKSQLKLNDIVIVQSGHVGECAVIDENYVNANCHALVILSPKDNTSVCSKFLVNYFYSSYGKKLIYHIKTGNTIEHVLASEVKELTPFSPELSEQTKIANFLTSVDEKITQLTQKGELLARYKKGVMQQIFSQQLRFKDDDGQDFPEWDVLELEKIACKVNTKNKDFAICHVLTNSATQGIVNQTDYFDKDIANQNNLGGYYVVEINDFVYNPRISSNALVGALKKNNLVKGVMSPLYTVFRFIKGNLSFFEQYFETTHWHDYMKSVANSGARHDRLNITNENFFSLPIPYPSIDEQTKIASFLTALDDKISHNQTQLNAVKQYNQGLLQQLFV